MNFKRYLIGLTLLIGALVLVGAVSAGVNTDRPIGEKRVVAHTQEEVSQAVSQGCVVVREVKNLTALRCPGNVAESLSLQEDIRFFAVNEGNSINALRGKPGSGGTTYPNPLNQIGADLVHADGNTGQGRVVVVLDTGYNYNHPELSSSYLAGGYDFVNDDADPMDDEGHGSHVAGIITADGPNAHGVAPDTQVVAIKVLDENGSGFFSDIIAGIYWAVDEEFGADAINISIGTSAPYLYKGVCDGVLPELTDAIKYATDSGVVVAVAAGNSGKQGVSLPGCISYSTTVGAVNNKDAVASFSGRGTSVDISAPGVSIYSTILGSAYASWSGTSMATPMITGAVALIKADNPSYTQSDVETALFTTAKDLGTAGKDKGYGWGRAQVNLAVQ